MDSDILEKESLGAFSRVPTRTQRVRASFHRVGYKILGDIDRLADFHLQSIHCGKSAWKEGLIQEMKKAWKNTGKGLEAQKTERER